MAAAGSMRAVIAATPARLRLRPGHQLARGAGALAVLLFGLFLLGALGWGVVPKALRILDEQQAWARGVDSKLLALCAPSQNGLLAEWPQRQRAMTSWTS